MAGFPEPRGIVGIEGLIDQIDDGNVAVNSRRLDRLAVQEAAFFTHRKRIVPLIANIWAVAPSKQS
jgi:hypothetical protein